jgi:beta-glucanase (GH16 family)
MIQEQAGVTMSSSPTNRTENVKVENGYLLLLLKKESYKGSSYTSARLTTKGLFDQAYGRFEARIRVPYGKECGLLWLLGSNIDEVGGHNVVKLILWSIEDKNQKVLGTVHGPGYSGGASITKAIAC